MKHNINYIIRRNELIPVAERIADTRIRKRIQGGGSATINVKGHGGQMYAHCLRSQYFHEEMAKLAKDL